MIESPSPISEREIWKLTGLNVEEIARLKRIFSVVDSDNDGFLSHAECGRAYAQLSIRIAGWCCCLFSFKTCNDARSSWLL